jgi:dGTP triphosphohydrolase
VALAHDLGHTPFGHTGEDAMEALMKPYGGFDHNAQALRIVTRLERHYADFDGLNLTWECLEGIAKHNGPVAPPLPYALAEANAEWGLELETFASAEAQVAAIADDVAYSHHDLHDGLRSGLFTEADLMELPVTGPAFEEVDRTYPGLEKMRRRHEALRRVFGRMVEDVIAVARNRLTSAQPKSVDGRSATPERSRPQESVVVSRRWKSGVVARIASSLQPMTARTSVASGFPPSRGLPTELARIPGPSSPTTRAVTAGSLVVARYAATARSGPSTLRLGPLLASTDAATTSSDASFHGGG